MTQFDIQSLIPQLIEMVPEIRSGYELMRKESIEGASHWTQDDFEDMRTIAHRHDLPKVKAGEPGITLVIENLLVPYVMKLAMEKKYSDRLKEIMSWVENLSASDVFEIRNLVAVSICEPLITTYQAKLKYVYPFLGKETRGLCVVQFSMYKMSDEAKRLFEVA